jgi:tetratricopeptide (TPR) repeat protein
MALASVILARNFVESVLEGEQVLGFTPLVRNSFFSFFDHFFLFYVSAFLWLILVLSLIVNEDARKVAKAAVLFSPVILVVPVVDIFLSKGMGYKLGYLEGVGQVIPAAQFFDLRGELLQVTWGQRIEVFSICCFASVYVWLKRSSLLRSVTAFALVYIILFIHGLPQALVDIPRAFGFDHGVRAIMGGGLVDVDSQNYALFMLLLLIPAAFLLLKRSDESLLRDIGLGLWRGRWWAAAAFCLLGLGLGYFLFHEHYKMTFVNPYTYIAFSACTGVFVLASNRTRNRYAVLFSGASCVIIALNLGWTCLLMGLCAFTASRFRKSLPLVLLFSFAGGLSLFSQQHTIGLALPGGVVRVRAFAKYRQAREHFIQKDWHNARRLYHESLSQGIGNHELYERLAETYVNLGAPDSAIPLFEKAIATSRNDPESYLGLGGIFQARGDFIRTIRVYDRAIEKRVLPDRFHLEKARIYFRTGDFDRARESLARSSLLGVEKDLLYQALADLEFFSSDFEEAYRLYQRVLFYRPRSGFAYNGMANIRHVEGRFEEALLLYMKALEFLPSDPTVLNNAGAAYLELGKAEEAYKMVSRALAIYPMLAEAHYNMGRIFELIGLREQAAESYRKALQVNPNVTGAEEALRALGESLP